MGQSSSESHSKIIFVFLYYFHKPCACNDLLLRGVSGIVSHFLYDYSSFFVFYFVFGATTPKWARASSFTRRSHTTTHHSRYDSYGRVISSSHRPLPDNTQHSQQTDIRVLCEIRTHDLNRRAAADLHLRPRGYWDRNDYIL
jgi:hypothetical protein